MNFGLSNLKTSIEFVNHASVIIKSNEISILSDPWFEEDAFNKGWNLLHETNDKEAENILNKITHIWLSHEHPDHFSILFFKKFKKKILDNSIKILFQETKDKRVINFLKKQSFNCQELKFNDKTQLSDDCSVTCIKDGFYDSGLLVESKGEKILNLNDCEVNSISRINEVKSITGEVDVLLTQFSFAAWKGGKNNKVWRKAAAKEKLKTIKIQVDHFKPKFIIPFASFIYFSNIENYYLNDSVNTPENVLSELKDNSSSVIIMKPNDILGGDDENILINNALDFWNKKYNDINKKKLHSYNTISLDEIFLNFENYYKRIKTKNNMWLMKLLRIVSPISVFKPVKIKISDLNCTVKFDYIKKVITKTIEEPQLIMKSESINFLFKNTFGFDTLTVNGCFEEEKNGFLTSAKTLAVENLNNLGINIAFKTLFNFSLIKLFLTRLYKVVKKLNQK